MANEVKVEHVLMFVVVIFLLYHLMDCNGDGFNVGAVQRKGSGNCLQHYSKKGECETESGCVWIEEGNYTGFNETDGAEAKCLSLGNLIDIRENDSQNCSSAFIKDNRDIGNGDRSINLTGDDGTCQLRGLCLPNTINRVGWSDTSAPTCGPPSCGGNGTDMDKIPRGSTHQYWEPFGNITQKDIKGYGCESNQPEKSYDGCWTGNRALCKR